MLDIDRLLSKVDDVLAYSCPTCPSSENTTRSVAKLELARVSPTCPTCPTCPSENTILATSNDGGAETPLHIAANELLHPRDCPQWWKGCLDGCEWYQPGGGDFCWKVNRAWWEEPYQGGEDDEEILMLAQEVQGGRDE